MKNSFTPCNTCNKPCEKAKGQAPENQMAIERLKEEQKIKECGCPYKEN